LLDVNDEDVQVGLASGDLVNTEPIQDGSEDELRQRLLKRIAAKLVPSTNEKSQAGGLFAVNALSFPVRQLVQTSSSHLSGEKPIYATHAIDEGQLAVFDTSACGFACIPLATPTKAKKTQPSVVDGRKLRNEFLECEVDEKTGGLRFVRSYESRTNQLSQQLSIRLGRPSSPQEEAPYARMVANDINTTQSTPVVGEIVSRGQLLGEDDNPIGTFAQTVSLQRGSRVIRVSVHVDSDQEFSSDVWNSYLCSRFAWSSESMDIIAGVFDRSMPTKARRFEAPLFVDLDDAANKTTILSGGIPFHRRIGARMLDSVLIVKGESARDFEFGIGIGLANPVRDAIQFLSVPTVSRDVQLPFTTQTGWLFHIDSKNVVVTSWKPIISEKERGFRVRLIETSGRATRAKIKTFRTINSARKVDFENNTLNPCDVTDGAIAVNLDGHEWTEIEGIF
jgi:alpha-mannosidase